MSSYVRSRRDFFELLGMLAIVGLIVSAVGVGVLYVRHERQAGSAANQLRRIDEEARRTGWVKAADGTWSLPNGAGTNGGPAPRKSSGPTNN